MGEVIGASRLRHPIILVQVVLPGGGLSPPSVVFPVQGLVNNTVSVPSGCSL